jgi:hypothetical protein
MEDKQKKQETKKVLTNKDILESHGLVEIYDPSIGAYRQVPKEEAEKMVEKLEEIKKAMEGNK